MADFIRSDQPTITASVDTAYETILLAVSNPTPTGGRPSVAFNQVWRKIHGSASGWTLVGNCAPNGTLRDLFLRADTQYDYFARTDTYADSYPITATTPSITGLWLHDPADMNGTLRHFPYGDAGPEGIGTEEQLLQFVGRQYPVVEAGVSESQSLAIQAVLPFSDADQRAQVEWWRARKRARATLLLRDGRGHAHAGYLAGDVTITPTRQGSTIGASFQRVDYVSATTTIGESYYTNGTTNDGGNGVYGNGSQGNGY
jgi:hypothetical protein